MFVSDHALLRWLERVHGVDVEYFRRIVTKEISPFARSGHYREIINGYEYRFDGMKLVTIIDRQDDDEDQERYAREKMARFFAHIPKAKPSKQPKQAKKKPEPSRVIERPEVYQHGDIRYWLEQPITRPAPQIDLSGARNGRMVCIGLMAGEKGKWVARCDCGIYETRSAKAIRNPENFIDRCHRCRAEVEKKIKKAKEDKPIEEWDEIAKRIWLEVSGISEAPNAPHGSLGVSDGGAQ